MPTFEKWPAYTERPESSVSFSRRATPALVFSGVHKPRLNLFPVLVLARIRELHRLLEDLKLLFPVHAQVPLLGVCRVRTSGLPGEQVFNVFNTEALPVFLHSFAETQFLVL